MNGIDNAYRVGKNSIVEVAIRQGYEWREIKLRVGSEQKNKPLPS
jgi:hypothetical protein